MWDPTLYAGSAAYYARGRLPYPSTLVPQLVDAAGIEGDERLLDVGCGPGIIALQLAPLVAEVVGVDADEGFVAEASRQGAPNARFLVGFGEEVDRLGLGTFDVVTFAQSFHWMDRPRAAAAARAVVRDTGVVVHIGATTVHGVDEPTVHLPYPQPPHDALKALVRARLGDLPRAGQGHLRFGTPDREPPIYAAAGFGPPDTVVVPGGEVVVRTADEIVANVFSLSSAAPHLFGDDVKGFEAEMRALLADVSPDGLFAEQLEDAELRIYRPA